ncbi:MULTISPECIES: hypothetical protein [Micromonospora]|uniref:hypothetical protein n=1 Tax=Micromonospora TaxID=1873 RepID=UPI0024162E29|nr:hypothetical protein [Micromonospora sp. WMMD718]MDG4749330.1 hypothetical protein [Micromonospora sp. WMMD718]MDG4756072.1 hypothetical protein [Micromonospora sp. WMMD718]
MADSYTMRLEVRDCDSGRVLSVDVRTIGSRAEFDAAAAAIADRLKLSEEQGEQPVSSVIAVDARFARAANGQPRYARAAGHPAGGDWVRLRTGSGRQYEGYRSESCPGDGVSGHQHDVRCVDGEAERG